MISIIPAAGKGTRMSSVTGGGAKEMLPVAGKPLIAHAFDEARLARVDEIVLVSSPLKKDLNDYFLSLEYPKRLVIQPEPTGLGPAVILAGLNEDAVVLLPDALYSPGMPAARIARMLAEGYDVVLYTEVVTDAQVKRFGILESATPTSYPHILEKPSPSDTASRLAIGGRYGFSSDALKRMAISMFEDPTPDMSLTPAINYALEQDLHFVHLEADDDERRFDCGSVSGYKKALKELG